MKNSPYARGFLVKIKLFLNYIRQRQNIPVASYQYSLGIYRWIYLAAGIRNIRAAPDISGTWRSRLKNCEMLNLVSVVTRLLNYHKQYG